MYKREYVAVISVLSISSKKPNFDFADIKIIESLLFLTNSSIPAMILQRKVKRNPAFDVPVLGLYLGFSRSIISLN